MAAQFSTSNGPDLEAAARRAHDAIDRMLRDVERSAGPCDKCRWGQAIGDEVNGRGTLFKRLCRNPLVSPPVYDTVTGEPWQMDVRASDTRRGGALCGPEGRLFEPKGALLAQVQQKAGRPPSMLLVAGLTALAFSVLLFVWAVIL